MNVGGVKRAIEREIAKMVSDDFTKAASDIIDDFYASYSPKYYTRTGLLAATFINPTTGSNYGGCEVDVLEEHRDYTMWYAGFRGLPPSYKGFVEMYYANIPEFGILAGSPHAAMLQLESKWGEVREPEVHAIIDKYIGMLDTFS